MSDNIRVINLNKGEVLASSGNDTEFIYYIKSAMNRQTTCSKKNTHLIHIFLEV